MERVGLLRLCPQAGYVAGRVARAQVLRQSCTFGGPPRKLLLFVLEFGWIRLFPNNDKQVTNVGIPRRIGLFVRALPGWPRSLDLGAC